MIIELIVLIVSVLLIKLYLYKRNLLKGLKHLPKIKYDLPIFGSLYMFLGKDTTQMMQAIMENISEHVTPSIFWVGHKLTFLIDNPEDMKAVLTSPNCLQKPYPYKFFGASLGIIFNSDIKLWMRDRKAINLTFNNRIINSFVPIFNEKVNKLCANLAQNELFSKESFNISKYILSATLEMVCGTTLGYNVGVQSERNAKFSHALENISESIAHRIANVYLHPECIYKRSNVYAKHKELLRDLYGLSIEIRRIKQKEFFDEDMHLKEPNGNDKTLQLFVNEMLKMYVKGDIDEAALDEQVINMIVAGNDTTGLACSHTLLMLAMNPDIQERVFKELTEVYDSQTEESTIEMINKLTYLEMVIKETMRLFPIVPIIGRECQAPTKLSNCTIPSKSFIGLSFYSMHRNPEIWDERANIFDPDHFTPEKVKSRHPYAYLPFSGGPRNCVAIKYAWIAMKIILASLLRNYRFTTDMKFEEIRFKWNVILNLANGHMVKIERRETFFNERVQL